MPITNENHGHVLHGVPMIPGHYYHFNGKRKGEIPLKAGIYRLVDYRWYDYGKEVTGDMCRIIVDGYPDYSATVVPITSLTYKSEFSIETNEDALHLLKKNF